jgi:hypothetical protein
LQDLLVLLLKSVKLDTARGGGWIVPDRPARYNEAAKILQEARELRVPGRSRDRTMERKIFVDSALAPVDRRLDGVEFFGDLFELRR